MNFDIKDRMEEKIFKKLGIIADLIEEKRAMGEVVLVHCYKGVSRAPTVVLAYLMKYEGLGFEEAWREVKNRAPKIDPNFGFLARLRNFAN